MMTTFPAALSHSAPTWGLRPPPRSQCQQSLLQLVAAEVAEPQKRPPSEAAVVVRSGYRLLKMILMLFLLQRWQKRPVRHQHRMLQLLQRQR